LVTFEYLTFFCNKKVFKKKMISVTPVRGIKVESGLCQ